MGSEHVAWLVAAGGWIFALVQHYLGYRERRDQHDDSLLAATLGYFTGGIQKRSVGIGLVEGIWLPKRRHLDVIAPVLVNQAVYLLLVSDAKEERHEERNLFRILSAIHACLVDSSLKNKSLDGEILNAILCRYSNQAGLGIPVSDVSLELWFRKFGGDVESLRAERA